MQRFLNTHLLISLNLVVFAFVVAAAAWVVYTSKEATRLAIEEHINQQTERMAELSEITDRNGADEVVAAIITDCPRRTEFESLLGKLGTLSHRDLLTMQQLFESCGNFYAERKALMVSRLVREYQVLNDNVTLLISLDPETDGTAILDEWGRLVELEQKRSDLLSEQTDIQSSIIIALVTGSNLSSGTVRESVSRAQELNETLSVLDKQIDEIRNGITS